LNPAARIQKRIELAEGHWELEEPEDALTALERGIAETPEGEPPDPRVASLAGRWLAELGESGGPASIRARLRALRDWTRWGRAEPEPELPEELAEELPEVDELEEEPILELRPPLATSTVAELLADQGHHEEALRVAEDVLRRNPADERAQAVRERLDPGSALDRRAARVQRIMAELERWLANLESYRTQGDARR
jgi:tetratricopeptide (TPR) repeat protein